MRNPLFCHRQRFLLLLLVTIVVVWLYFSFFVYHRLRIDSTNDSVPSSFSANSAGLNALPAPSFVTDEIETFRYSPFCVDLPLFIDEKDAFTWYMQKDVQGLVEETLHCFATQSNAHVPSLLTYVDRVHYFMKARLKSFCFCSNRILTGQNYLIANAILTTSLRRHPCSTSLQLEDWRKVVSPAGAFATLQQPWKAKTPLKRLVFPQAIAVTADQQVYFQHFIDITLNKMAQAYHWFHNGTVLLVPKTSNTMVKRLLAQVTQRTAVQVVVMEPGTIYQVEKLITSCNAPQWVPPLWRSGQELIFSRENRPTAFPHAGVEMVEETEVLSMPTIWWLHRGGSGDSKNAGRRVTNEDEVVEVLQQFCADVGCRVETFRAESYESLGHLQETWRRKHVVMLVGPHGGALTNMYLSALQGLTIIELHAMYKEEEEEEDEEVAQATWPNFVLFYMMASMLGEKYVPFLADATGGQPGSNMHVNTEKFRALLDAAWSWNRSGKE
jgi:hypothetical protein